MRHEASPFAGTLAPVLSYTACLQPLKTKHPGPCRPCANCIVIRPENRHVGCIDCTGPTLGDASKYRKKLAEQLRDNYGGIILDRVRKNI